MRSFRDWSIVLATALLSVAAWGIHPAIGFRCAR